MDVGIGKKRGYWVTKGDLQHAREWFAAGFTEALKTPDETLIFVEPEEKNVIRHDQAECMGCLSQCAFSSWADNEKNSTGRSPIRAASASRRRFRTSRMAGLSSRT